MKSFKVLVPLCVMLLFALSCQQDLAPEFEQSGNLKSNDLPSAAVASVEDMDAQMLALLDGVNAFLESEGEDYRAVMAEYMTAAQGSEEAGRTVFFNNVGNKQLTADFVPFDARRSGWSGSVSGADDDITYAVDQVDAATPNGVSGAATTAAIDRAMTTWDNANCSDLPIVKNPDFGIDMGLVAFLNGLGGASPFILADIMHAGWTDIDFSGGIIGVTYTFIFIDGGGNPTDIDNNGKLDVAFREIYYDPSFSWAINGNIDVETVALHEAGHGLSQAHFGKLHRTDANGLFHFSPRAVMNAGYTGPQQSLAGTDNAGHCSLWGSWPQN